MATAKKAAPSIKNVVATATTAKSTTSKVGGGLSVTNSTTPKTNTNLNSGTGNVGNVGGTASGLNSGGNNSVVDKSEYQNGIRTKDSAGNLTDYGASLERQNINYMGMDVQDGYNSKGGTYGNLTPTYEAYAANAQMNKQAFMDRATWEKTMADSGKTYMSNSGGGGAVLAGTSSTYGAGNSSSLSSSKDSVSTMYDTLAAAQKASVTSRMDKARNDAISGMDQEKVSAEQSQRDRISQARTASELGTSSFAEYLARRGLSSSGSAALGEINRVTALQNSESTIGNETASTLSGIEQRKTSANQTHDSELNTALADIESQRVSGLISNATAEAAAKRAEDQFNATLNQNAYQFNQSQAQNQSQFNQSQAQSQSQFNANMTFQEASAEYARQQDAINFEYKKEQDAINNAFNNKQLTLQQLRDKQAKLEADRTYKLNLITTQYNTSKPYFKPSSGGQNNQTVDTSALHG